MHITFIQTGGTIDKDYLRRVKAYEFEIRDAAVKRILEAPRPNFTFKIISILKKDSLDITQSDRINILRACRTSSSKRIVITHGTDTLVETAKVLSVIRNKTIILTGSSKPERFTNSDAMFNVGHAVGAAQLLPPGVYVAMNGRVYPWDKVRKHQKTGIFIEA